MTSSRYVDEAQDNLIADTMRMFAFEGTLLSANIFRSLALPLSQSKWPLLGRGYSANNRNRELLQAKRFEGLHV